MMTQRKNCIYCNKAITQRSSEHVIQNALGGLYESTDICCPECNNFISRHIDAPFTKIFNPIIGRIYNFSKTNKTKSLPPCTGKATYNGKTYDVNIKAGKVVACPELSRELRCDISNLPLKIIAYDFDLNNDAFHTGMAKIAFNYAMAQNVDFKYLEPGLKVDKQNGMISNITYDYKIVPFCPMNQVDVCIETNHKYEDPFHNMILFSQQNELWCYIDLFNTFQYYVLLSETIPNNEQIYANYTQTLQKLNRNPPDLQKVHTPKDMIIYAQQYGIKPCMNKQELEKQINIAIMKQSQKIPMAQIYEPKLKNMPFAEILKNAHDKPESVFLFYRALMLYFNNDEFQEQNFRTLTPSYNNNEIWSYPHKILDVLSKDTHTLRMYTNAKMNNLTQYLNHCGR